MIEMLKNIILIIFIFNPISGQDTLITVSGQILMGQFIKTTAQHIVFKVDYEKYPLLIEKKMLKPLRYRKWKIWWNRGN